MRRTTTGSCTVTGQGTTWAAVLLWNGRAVRPSLSSSTGQANRSSSASAGFSLGSWHHVGKSHKTIRYPETDFIWVAKNTVSRLSLLMYTVLMYAKGLSGLWVKPSGRKNRPMTGFYRKNTTYPDRTQTMPLTEYLSLKLQTLQNRNQWEGQYRKSNCGWRIVRQ